MSFFRICSPFQIFSQPNMWIRYLVGCHPLIYHDTRLYQLKLLVESAGLKFDKDEKCFNAYPSTALCSARDALRPHFVQLRISHNCTPVRPGSPSIVSLSDQDALRLSCAMQRHPFVPQDKLSSRCHRWMEFTFNRVRKIEPRSAANYWRNIFKLNLGNMML
jgi:hypothetical protein